MTPFFLKRRLLNEYQIMETEKDALTMKLVIMEGERSDFKARISQLESRDSATNQQVEELKSQVE